MSLVNCFITTRSQYWRLLITGLLSVYSLNLEAQQIYRAIDEQGNVIFSDSPTAPDSQPIELSPIQTYRPLPPTTNELFEQPPKPTEPVNTYQQLEIISPTNEQTFQNTTQIPVQLSFTPTLFPGDELYILRNGEPAAGPMRTSSTSVVINDRGEHTLVAQIRRDGVIIEESAPVIFFLHRAVQRFRVSPIPG